VDCDEYNPGNDPYLAAGYDVSNLERRVANKLALQQRMNLPRNSDIPLIGMVQRLDEQKGFDIFQYAADAIVREMGAQIVILGNGRDYYENMIKGLAGRYPRQVALSTAFDNPLAHLIYGGCDMFLMPSRFEPCGLGQLIAMCYGAVPVVRHTGGLADTVVPLTPDLKEGYGFVFRDYLPDSLIATVRAAVKAYYSKESWHQVMERIMRLDFSWRASAAKYEAAYKQALKSRNVSIR
jgi:starch synthase